MGTFNNSSTRCSPHVFFLEERSKLPSWNRLSALPASRQTLLFVQYEPTSLKRVVFNTDVERRVITTSPVVTSDSKSGSALYSRSTEAAEVSRVSLLLGTTLRITRIVSYACTYLLPYNQTVALPVQPGQIKPASDGEHNTEECGRA